MHLLSFASLFEEKIPLNGQLSFPPETDPFTKYGEIGKEERRGQKEERGEQRETLRCLFLEQDKTQATQLSFVRFHVKGQ